ncbi:unnamed protein product [Ectocarpus sp. 6 AP-2014]
MRVFLLGRGGGSGRDLEGIASLSRPKSNVAYISRPKKWGQTSTTVRSPPAARWSLFQRDVSTCHKRGGWVVSTTDVTMKQSNGSIVVCMRHPPHTSVLAR